MTFIKVAVLDMYKGSPNLGLASVLDILSQYKELEVETFDVRQKRELPGTNYDLYVSSGGPGSPLEGDGIWERGWYYLMEKLWQHNQRFEDKKYAFFICHSFQMICQFLSLGSMIKRNAQSLGTYPVHKTPEGDKHWLTRDLPDPFYVGDSRRWQFVEPIMDRMEQLGCKILAIEKPRPHVPLEQAIMAMQFSEEWIGVQFHPEANSTAMLDSLLSEPAKLKITEERGEARYEKIITMLQEFGPQMDLTYHQILPGFIQMVITKLAENHRS